MAEESKKEVAVVVTLDGVFGFIGEVNEARSNSSGVYLDNALTIGYDTDGTPFPTFGQLPVGSADPSKPMCTVIPTGNISYMVTMGSDDEHRLVEQYYEFFKQPKEDMIAAD